MTGSHSTRQVFAAPSSRRWAAFEDDPGSAAYSQGALALTYPLPGGLDAEPQPRGLTLLLTETGDDVEIPDAQQWASRLIQAVVEVVSSDRPLSQLARWIDSSVYDDLARRREQVARHRKPGHPRNGRQQVATVHVWQPSTRSAEVAARVMLGGRSRAIAARLDFHRGRWLCTALTFG